MFLNKRGARNDREQNVLLVTGGSRGIGAAICLLGAKAGYRVAVNYASNEAAAESGRRGDRGGGGEAVAVQGDVGSEADVARDVRRRWTSAYGRLDALVNNAGIVDDARRASTRSRWRGSSACCAST